MEKDLKTSQTAQASYIDGRKQVIELMRALPHNEKMKLLSSIKVRNPQMAQELLEEGISFEQLLLLEDNNLKIITNYIPPQILGLALKSASTELAKRFLSVCNTDYANTAYQVMTTPMPEQMKKGQNSQEKIIKTALQLFGKTFFIKI